MSDKSKIEWTDATWNPVVGCTRVSAGCDNCYAVRQSHRLAGMRVAKYAGLTVLNKAGQRHFNGVVRTRPRALLAPLGWSKPRHVFVNSMSDLFHEDVPTQYIYEVMAVMALCPQHKFQVLTKRPERAAECLNDIQQQGGMDIDRYVWELAACMEGELVEKRYQDHAKGVGHWPLHNVWLGTSCEDQTTFDKRIPHLRACTAEVRFLSLEPLLGPIQLGPLDGINWVIVGGESGPGARPMHPEWACAIRDQCRAAGVPFFFKQWGEWHPGGTISDSSWDKLPRLMVCECGTSFTYADEIRTRIIEHQEKCSKPGYLCMYRAGKKRAGRMLDGRTWDEMPK